MVIKNFISKNNVYLKNMEYFNPASKYDRRGGFSIDCSEYPVTFHKTYYFKIKKQKYKFILIILILYVLFSIF